MRFRFIFSFAIILLVSIRGIAAVPQLRNWGLFNTVGNSHIHAQEAWKIEEGSKDVVVAVIDTGIDPNHPDLKNNLWHEKETGIYGWDFVLNKANPGDEHSHGTHVAGILGAMLNPNAGVSGVARKVSIMPVRYYSEKNTGTENLQNSIKALNWAIDHGAQIINYSGGGPEYSAEEYTALKRAQDKGILLVAAAGNEHQNSDIPSNFYYPCAYKQLSNVICVAATNIRNEILPSSNWGKNSVDVAAPGENILSTVPGGRYAYMTGTSQATAFVTGLAALILAKSRFMKPEQVRDVIRASVDKFQHLKERTITGGKVNAVAALKLVESMKQKQKAALVAKTSVLPVLPVLRKPLSPKATAAKSKAAKVTRVKASGVRKSAGK